MSPAAVLYRFVRVVDFVTAVQARIAAADGALSLLDAARAELHMSPSYDDVVRLRDAAHALAALAETELLKRQGGQS